MLDYPVAAWEHGAFCAVLGHAVDGELGHRAIEYYVGTQPELLADLLTSPRTGLLSRLDHARTVKQLRSFGTADAPLVALHLASPYLHAVVDACSAAGVPAPAAVLVAVHDLAIDAALPEAVRQSALAHLNEFDAAGLAQRLTGHEELAFRRVAAAILAGLHRWQPCVTLCCDDACWEDAIAFAAQSSDRAVCERLMAFFVERATSAADNEAAAPPFSSSASPLCSFPALSRCPPTSCSRRPGRHGLSAEAMPFFIGTMARSERRLAELEAEVALLRSAAPRAAAATAGDQGFFTSPPTQSTF
eukprot:gnl/Ergobibamus_cyprinoides/746.p1 GENE.gnl/Ergobibamus_cyprinoides/746~~gnl/Ergobibamus_cyprinoides/746.p1  ORF type:complete len:351 (+),score=116.79 gnl/Ergobibamus_cyprinoides/746:146-1054(+)